MDSQFLTTDGDLPEALRYTSLWATKDVNRIHEIKVFWVFMEASIQIGINVGCTCPLQFITTCKVWKNSRQICITYISKHSRIQPKHG